MPRTFSLARLMLGITLFCVLCGFIVSFPEFSLAAALAGCFFAPSALVTYFLARRSSQAAVFLPRALCGAAFFLIVTVLVPSSPHNPFVIDFLFISIPPAIGTAIFGGLLLATELPRENKAP